MAWVAVQAGRLDGTVSLCSPAAPDTKPWGHCYRRTAKHPPVARMKTTQVPGQDNNKKEQSGSLRGSYLGQEADANVGQKEPLLSIKKEERTVWSNGGG